MQLLDCCSDFRNFPPILAVMAGRLHWLPAHRRTQFKLLLIVAKCIAGRAPSYLREQCIQVSSVPGRRSLRSAYQLLLTVPRCHGASAHQCSFSMDGPSAWNCLPMTDCMSRHLYGCMTMPEAAVRLPRGSFKKDLIIIIIIIINEIFVMCLSKQTPQKRIAADYIDLKSSVLSSFLKAAKINVQSFRIVDRLSQAAGPATENPRLPIVAVFADGVRRSPAMNDNSMPMRDTYFVKLCDNTSFVFFNSF